MSQKGYSLALIRPRYFGLLSGPARCPSDWRKKELTLMTVASLREKVILYALMSLILWFFAIPVIAYCFLDCKPFIPKRIASVLLFFFR
jgi:hypothetical protein